MKSFTTHRGVAVPLLRNNIDTDAIIPSRDIRRVSKSGLGMSLFSNWRYLYEGDRRTGPDPAFVLNDPAYAGPTILLAGENFGCGSSREQAVWALMDFGIRVIIAPAFGDIFYNNCFENGLLPVRMALHIVNDLANQVAEDPPARMLEIRLADCTVIAPDGKHYSFEIEAMRRQMLLEGLDAIAMTQSYAQAIEAFEIQDRRKRPWAYLGSPNACARRDR